MHITFLTKSKKLSQKTKNKKQKTKKQKNKKKKLRPKKGYSLWGKVYIHIV